MKQAESDLAAYALADLLGITVTRVKGKLSGGGKFLIPNTGMEYGVKIIASRTLQDRIYVLLQSVGDLQIMVMVTKNIANLFIIDSSAVTGLVDAVPKIAAAKLLTLASLNNKGRFAIEHNISTDTWSVL